MKSKEQSSGLVKFSLEYPYFIIVAVIIVFILGGLSILRLPKDLLPVANDPAVQVLAFYPGMPVENIEQDLATRIERYTSLAVGLRKTESRSLNGVTVIRNFFQPEISLDNAISQIGSMVTSVMRKLPPGTQPPLLLPFDPMASSPLALVAVSGSASEKTLRDIARYNIGNVIQSIPGAMAPTVMGGSDRQVLTMLDPQKLKNYDFSPLEVLNRLITLNTFIPTGEVKIGDLDYQIVSNGLAPTIQEMNDYPLRAFQGTTIKVKDVGEAKDAAAIQTNVVRINGKRQVYVPVYRQPGANSLGVVDQLQASVKDLSQQFKDVTLTILADQSQFVRHAVSSIAEETIIGATLAALCVLLFLGNIRATGGILLSLPISILFAFIGLLSAKETINVMTLGGLALSIGVLVDNSIVVLENIITKMHHGLSSADAAEEGASEVAMPVLASTLATIIVLFPVVFLNGVSKVLFVALAKAVIFAMVGSYLASMMVIPLFAKKYLTGHQKTEELPALIRRSVLFIEFITKKYADSIQILLNKKWIVFTACFVVFISGLFLATRTGGELFPRADVGSFVLKARLPSGTRIEKTEEFAANLEEKVHEWIPEHDLKMIVTNIGIIAGFPAAYTPNSGPQDLYMIIELTHDREKTTQFYAQQIRPKIKEQFPNAEFSFELGGLLTSALNGGLPSAIDIQISGPKLDRSGEVARHLATLLEKIPGAVDVRVQQKFDNPVLQINVDRQKVGEYGLEVDSIMKNIVSAVSGSPSFSPNIWIDPTSGIDYFFGVMVPEKKFVSKEDLLAIPLSGRSQERTVPLKSIAEITEKKGPSEINHKNLLPVVDLYVDAQGTDIASVARKIEKVLSETPLPDGYKAEVKGEYGEMASAFSSFVQGFILAAVLVYLVLVTQFKSFVIPAVVMCSVPVGLSGIFFMLYFTNTYFSIQAAIGAIFMIGTAVAASVVMVEFLIHKDNGLLPRHEAIVEGAAARFRPIVMTSLTAVLGVVPMALGLGKGSEASIPLGRAVMGGQIVATIVTLFLVPLLFDLIKSRQKTPPTPILKNGVIAFIFVTLISLAPTSSRAKVEFLPILKTALQKGPIAKAEAYRRAEREEAILTAKARNFPRISFMSLVTTGFPGSAGATQVGGLMVSPFHKGPSAGLMFEHDFMDFGRRDSQIEVAKGRAELAKARSRITLAQAAESIFQTYLNCIYDHEIATAVRPLSEDIRRLDREVNRYVKTGQRSVVEGFLSQAQVEEVRTLLQESHERQKKDFDILSVWAEKKIDESETCDPLPPELLAEINQVKSMELKSPELDQARAEVKVAEAELKGAKAEHMPRLVSVGSYGAMQRTELDYQKQNYSFAVGLILPLFDGLRTTHEERRAVARMSQVQSEYDVLKERILSQTSEVDREIAALAARLQSLSNELKIAVNAWSVAKKRYESFRGNLQDVREAFRNYLRVTFDKENCEQRILLQKFRRYLVVNGIEEMVDSEVGSVK